MGNFKIESGFLKKQIILTIGMLFFLCFTFQMKAQEQPPKPISVSVYLNQGLNFGGFTQGSSGGSVIVYPDGSRSSTGDVVLYNLGFLVSPVIFEIEGNAGTIISLLNGPPAVLTGSNGGSMTLTLGGSDPPSPFINTSYAPSLFQVRVGGTLTVGNALANPPGDYNGTFMITFIQE
ncbi:MAG TPA: DUF4402 domain-containing protein [Bacteroidales bacterium]